MENGCPLQKVEQIETGQTGLNRWLQAVTLLTSNRWLPFSCSTVPSTSALNVSQLFIPRFSQQTYRINITTEMNKMRDNCFTCNRKEDPDSLVWSAKRSLTSSFPPPWVYHVHQRWNPSPHQTWWKPSHLQRLQSLQKNDKQDRTRPESNKFDEQLNILQEQIRTLVE